MELSNQKKYTIVLVCSIIVLGFLSSLCYEQSQYVQTADVAKGIVKERNGVHYYIDFKLPNGKTTKMHDNSDEVFAVGSQVEIIYPKNNPGENDIVPFYDSSDINTFYNLYEPYYFLIPLTILFALFFCYMIIFKIEKIIVPKKINVVLSIIWFGYCFSMLFGNGSWMLLSISIMAFFLLTQYIVNPEIRTQDYFSFKKIISENKTNKKQ